MQPPRPIPRFVLDDPIDRALLIRKVSARIDWPEESLDCWLWTGPVFHHGHGYTVIRVGDAYFKFMVHRLTWAWINGDTEKHLDHWCQTPRCVNPGHLREATPKENTRNSLISPAALNAAKDHCVNGHPLYGDNLYPTQSGKRRCKACANQISRDSKNRLDYGSAGKGTRKFRRNGPDKTHCKNGHPWIPANIRIKKNGHAECRACHRERESARQQRLREAAKSD